jgi:hypothetical protein
MATANSMNFGWFRYTDDQGGHWSVRAEAEWGAAGASGLAGYNAADPVFPTGYFYRTRKVLLQDLVSGRKTKRVLGTSAASAGVPGATYASNTARGAGGTLTLTSLGTLPERKPHSGTIISKADEITT